MARHSHVSCPRGQSHARSHPLPDPCPPATALCLGLHFVTENSRNFLSGFTGFYTAHFITVTVFTKDNRAEDPELYRARDSEEPVAAGKRLLPMVATNSFLRHRETCPLVGSCMKMLLSLFGGEVSSKAFYLWPVTYHPVIISWLSLSVKESRWALSSGRTHWHRTPAICPPP